MVSNCRKFVPNIFNKNKCQNCFAVKENHSQEALESNKASRKIVICDYLFVSPDYDFTNPMERTRRWQRRFFVLYDDGELTYAVDENPGTVPQGSVDMNKCVDVRDAEALTGHLFSIAVAATDKVHYIKGSSKFEIARWYDILVQYPRSKTTTKSWKSPPSNVDKDPIIMQTRMDDTDQHSTPDSPSDTEESQPVSRAIPSPLPDPSHVADVPIHSEEPTPPNVVQEALNSAVVSTYRGVRDLKHKANMEGMRKSNSMYELSTIGVTENASRSRSHSHERVLDNDRKKASRTFRDYSPLVPSFLERFNTYVNRATANRPTERQSRPQRSSDPPSDVFRKRSRSFQGLPSAPFSVHPAATLSLDLTSPRSNETDELKAPHKNVFVKKGWLIRQTAEDKEWNKHWFVLTGDSLRYYQDAKAEETSAFDGQIDLCASTQVEQFDNARNYGFRVTNENSTCVMSAMTSGIRNNWIRAIRQSVDRIKTRQASQSLTSLSVVVGDKSKDAAESRRLETAKPVRRHYSDLNLRHMGDLFVVGDIKISDDDPKISQHAADGESPYIARDVSNKSPSSTPKNVLPSLDLKLVQSRLSQHDGRLGGSGPLSTISFRYVEGSDAVDSRPTSHGVASDDPVRHAAKPPSVKVKDKSRSKSPRRLHSPPPITREHSEATTEVYGQVENEDTTAAVEQPMSELEELRRTNRSLREQIKDASSRPLSPDASPLSPEDGGFTDPATSSSHIRKQLIKSQETVYRQKTNIENLQVKLDQSQKRLTKSEDEFSKSVNDLRQEKEKFLRLSDDWNARIKSLEDQLSEMTHLLDAKKEELTTVEGKCKRLEHDVRNKQDKLREKDRELVKVKAIERENKEMKESLEKTYRELIAANNKLNEREKASKEVMEEYEKQLDEMDQQCAEERDELTEHLDRLRRQFTEVQRQNVIASNANSDMSDIIREKDDIISQLEEKVIETDNRIAKFMEAKAAADLKTVQEFDRTDVVGRTSLSAGSDIERVESLQSKLNAVKSCVVELSSVLSNLKINSSQYDVSKVDPYIEYLMTLLKDYCISGVTPGVDLKYLRHDIRVDVSTSPRVILDEYHSLKEKFDKVVDFLNCVSSEKMQYSYYCSQLDALRVRLGDLNVNNNNNNNKEIGDIQGNDIATIISSLDRTVSDLEDSFRQRVKSNDQLCKLGSGIRNEAIPVSPQLVKVEQKFVESKSKLGDCASQLSNIIEQVESFKSPVKQLISHDVSGEINRTNIAQKHLMIHSLLANCEAEKRNNDHVLSEQDKLQITAEKLSCEAAILCELLDIVEAENSDNVVVNLMKKINRCLTDIFSLEQTILNEPSDKLFSKYAKLLAERIVYQGELFGCLKTAGDEDGLEDCVNECILAYEVMTRSESDLRGSCKDSRSDDIDDSVKCLIANALLQSEITVALKSIRYHHDIKRQESGGSINSSVVLNDLLMLLNERGKTLTEIADRAKMEQISRLSYIVVLKIKQSSQDASYLDKILRDIEVDLKKFGEKKLSSVKDHLDADCYETCVSTFSEEFEFAVSHFKSMCSAYMIDLSHYKGETTCVGMDFSRELERLGEVLSSHARCTGSVMYINSVFDRITDPQTQDAQTIVAEKSKFQAIFSKVLHKEVLAKKKLFEQMKADMKDRDVHKHLEKTNQIVLSRYPDILVREAVYQAQLSYTCLKQKILHKLEMPQSHLDEGDIKAHGSSFNELETILTKHERQLLEEQDYIVSSLKSLGNVVKETKVTADSEKSLSAEINDLIVKIQEKAKKGGSEDFADVKSTKSQLLMVFEDYEHEKETLIADYEDHIAQLEEEIEIMNDQHENEFDQLKQDMFTAVSAIKASEEQTETDKSNEIMSLKHQLSTQRAKVMMELRSMRCSIPHSQRDTKLAVALLGKIQNIEAILTGLRSSQESLIDFGQPDYNSESSSEGESDAELDHADVTSDVETSKGTPSSGTSEHIDIQLHKRILLRMHERHKVELETRDNNKAKALEGEMKSTKAALEAMRKTYEEELQEERNRYAAMMDGMYSQDDVGDLSKKHSVEAEHLREEIAKVKKKYSATLEELRYVRESHEKMMSKSQRDQVKSQQKFDQMHTNLQKELEKLRSLLTSKSGEGKGDRRDSGSHHLVLKLKDTEIKHLREQVRNSRERLTLAEQKHSQTAEEYDGLKQKHAVALRDHDAEVEALNARLEQLLVALGADGKGSRRHVKRVASFTSQRSRSPSPQRCVSVRKDSTGHASREGIRRRHIHPRDLRRSKSSPSVPSLNKSPESNKSNKDPTTQVKSIAPGEPATTAPETESAKRSLFLP